jgi:hypothetical protein
LRKSFMARTVPSAADGTRLTTDQAADREVREPITDLRGNGQGGRRG